MWSKRIWRTSALTLILALLLALPGLAAVHATQLHLTLRRGEARHEAYLHGYDDGLFRPNGFITRAEEAQMIYNLLEDKPADRAALSDVYRGDWYYDALGLLAAAGIVSPDAFGCVEPNAQLTRAQFLTMLVNLFPNLPEVDCSYPDLSRSDPWYGAIAKATAAGWVNGYEDGTFRAEGKVTRAEAATIINRALGRRADRVLLDAQLVIPLYGDLTPAHWAYYEIMEASISHRVDPEETVETWIETDEAALRFPSGPVFAGLELYYADENGYIVRDQTVGTLYFGANGRYTSRDAELDDYVRGILSEIVTEDMTPEEKLLAAYDYVVGAYSYLRRSDAYDPGVTGWEVEEALTILRTGRGNCYCYAGIMCLLARQLGYDAKAISGTCNWTPRPHAWVEIEFDGVPYIFDTEMEMASKGKYGDHHFYMLSYDIEATLWPYNK
jgi:transglutaminase-like putative cysteine protease